MLPPRPTVMPLDSRASAVRQAVIVLPFEPVTAMTRQCAKSSSQMAVDVVTSMPFALSRSSSGR